MSLSPFASFVCPAVEGAEAKVQAFERSFHFYLMRHLTQNAKFSPAVLPRVGVGGDLEASFKTLNQSLKENLLKRLNPEGECGAFADSISSLAKDSQALNSFFAEDANRALIDRWVLDYLFSNVHHSKDLPSISEYGLALTIYQTMIQLTRTIYPSEEITESLKLHFLNKAVLIAHTLVVSKMREVEGDFQRNPTSIEAVRLYVENLMLYPTYLQTEIQKNESTQGAFTKIATPVHTQIEFYKRRIERLRQQKDPECGASLKPYLLAASVGAFLLLVYKSRPSNTKRF